jgi:hypothetical protein
MPEEMILSFMTAPLADDLWIAGRQMARELRIPGKLILTSLTQSLNF